MKTYLKPMGMSLIIGALLILFSGQMVFADHRNDGLNWLLGGCGHEGQRICGVAAGWPCESWLSGQVFVCKPCGGVGQPVCVGPVWGCREWAAYHPLTLVMCVACGDNGGVSCTEGLSRTPGCKYSSVDLTYGLGFCDTGLNKLIESGAKFIKMKDQF